MPTVGERLATLERRADENARGIGDILVLLNGGGDIEYARSVRGRLHQIESALTAMAIRRNYGLGMLRGWERFVLMLVAFSTVAASWYAALAH